MYLTAHRVQAPQSQQTEIHVFAHLHDGNGDDLFNGTMSDAALLKRVTETEPGRLVDKEIELRAGGNAVLSFIDVVAPDHTPQSDLLSALEGFRESMAAAPEAKVERHGAILVSFGAVFGLQGLEVREYDNLCEKLRGVIERLHASKSA